MLLNNFEARHSRWMLSWLASTDDHQATEASASLRYCADTRDNDARRDYCCQL
jgi:hypothetical protein